QTVVEDPLQLNKTITELRHFSLVQLHNEKVSGSRILTIHRLIQRALRDEMDSETLHLWIVRIAHMLNEIFPKDIEISTWQQCQQCLPHVLNCLPFFKEEGITSVDVTGLLNKAGTYLREWAHYEKAEELYQDALTIRENILEIEEADRATSLHNFALLYYKQGQYIKAEHYYQQALEMRKRASGSHPLDLATSLDDISGLYYSLGQYSKAEKLCREGLEIRKKEL